MKILDPGFVREQGLVPLMGLPLPHETRSGSEAETDIDKVVIKLSQAEYQWIYHHHITFLVCLCQALGRRPCHRRHTSWYEMLHKTMVELNITKFCALYFLSLNANKCQFIFYK